ncbi:latent-transforming growth factor beta-binding protein 4 [Aplochiton taeniatus]
MLQRLCILVCVVLCPLPVEGQTTTQRGGGGGRGGGAGAGRGAERIQVLFTPTICKVRCTAGGRCTNVCNHGNVTTLYNSEDAGAGQAFRVFLCPMLCQNGGMCVQKDRCLCPPNFTGKFCQIPASPASSTNEIVKPPPSSLVTNQQLTQSEFLLPLQPIRESHRQGQPAAPGSSMVKCSAPGSSMVKVRVQHPSEASVQVHQVLQVGYGAGLSPRPRASQRVQAQTVTGDGTYTQNSGFKYCFREVHNRQCSSPLPGLRSKDTCCRGIGKAWGINECVLCPPGAGNQGNNSCPVGFERINGTQCVDMNECLAPGLCENGLCVNTRGSYSCVCKAGFILDASHGICISQKVISEEKGQCYRVLGSGQGQGSCSLPILRNITKQICCCSRVGKAWGTDCQRCPYFGSVSFKEICPAGPGYHYSASALQFSQRQVSGPTPVAKGNGSTRDQQLSTQVSTTPQQPPRTSGVTTGSINFPTGPQQQPSTGSDVDECRTAPPVCGPGRCQNTAGSYRCTCPHGYQVGSGGTSCTDVNECVQLAAVCPVGECVNSVGSYKCVCPAGYRGNAQETLCQDIDECQQNPCSNGRCDNTPGSYKCVCRLGYKLDGYTCIDLDECEDPLQCPGQECVNSQGSYRCVSCQPGFGLLNGQCSDIDECRQNPCSNGRCDNTPGSYKCVCRLGYKLDGTACTDVDECSDPSQCPGQQCVNAQGSYRCVSCKPGFTLLNRQCTDVDECSQTPPPCGAGRCDNTPGSFRCVCGAGYTLQDNTCTDIDECVTSSQCPGQQCVNTQGSYRCVSCQAGHTMRDGACSDVDECMSGADPCGGQRVCVNTVGSFQCDCLPGYRTAGAGRLCRDINECLEGDFCFPRGECVNMEGSYRYVDECVQQGPLCQDGRCVNTEGSYQCLCNNGFSSNPEKTTCLDVDECVSSEAAGCTSRRCENTIGSYRCVTSCDPGLQATPTGECVDVNECSNETLCGEHGFCQNLLGSFQCVCDQGYTSTRQGKACVDEDECVSMQGVCGAARCENVEGSFMCECDGKEEEYDTRSGQCTRRTPPGNTHTHTLVAIRARPASPSSPLAPLPAPLPGELRECYYNLAEQGSCSLLATNTSRQECCCTVGQAWGLGCQYQPCPAVDTVEHLSLCPSGRGYVTAGPGAFSYGDVDECKRFQPEVCKSGVCVNNIPGYTCYCSAGYVYDATLLECVDHDECESEDSCPGGLCVNTVGSYYCTCEPPLVLDDTQRNCVNSTHLTVDENLSFCWQHVTADLVCQSPLMGGQVTFTECCCLYGDGWGLQCALCPARDSEDFAALCNPVLRPPPPFLDPYDSFVPGGAGYGRGDYDDYSPAGGRTPPYNLPEQTYPQPGYIPEGYYEEGDYGPPVAPPRPPFRLPDPRSERAFGVLPPPPYGEGRPLSLAPLPEEEEEEPWRPGPPFPPFRDGGGGGGGGGGPPRRVYERRYQPYSGLSAEDCGILRGCENGRCIRVAEGYTCDCFEGYELDMTSMTCTDINECEEAEVECVNSRCVNTNGSYRCICRPGYIMSRRPNHCVVA